MATYGQRKTPPNHRIGEPKKGRVILALLGGVFIGLLLAVGVAFYVSNMSLPFSKTEPVDDKLMELESEQKLPTLLNGGETVVAPPTTALDAAPAEEVIGSEETPAEDTDNEGIKSSDSEDAKKPDESKSDKSAEKPEDKEKDTTKPADKSSEKPAETTSPKQQEHYDFYEVLPKSDTSVAVPAPVETVKPKKSNDRFYVQAGAFKNAKDADNLKAGLALMGVEASIHTVIDPQKSTLHRVRVGPFKSQQEAENALKQLSDTGSASQPSIIKIPGSRD